MDNPFQSPAVISFCPGILGIERGLARTGVHCRVAAYVEIEAFIIANLVTGMEAGILDPAPIWTDAKTFDARPFRGRIHGIIGGYPCPGESLAGLREGHLYKGFIWPAIRRAIAATRPLFCFFENVDDHLTGTYPIVQRSLCNMGYRVEADVYTAEEVGASHERERLFILAMANGYCDELARRFGKISAKATTDEIKTWIKIGERLWDESGNRCKEVGNSKGVRKRKQTNKTDTKPTKWDSRNEFIYTSSDVGDGISEGLAFGQKQSTRKEFETIKRAGIDLWPAGQGYFQFEWEEPRTVEPGMGCTIDGYIFREDLLRALGNSVVEQQAEIAFIDLLRKHIA